MCDRASNPHIKKLQTNDVLGGEKNEMINKLSKQLRAFKLLKK